MTTRTGILLSAVAATMLAACGTSPAVGVDRATGTSQHATVAVAPQTAAQDQAGAAPAPVSDASGAAAGGVAYAYPFKGGDGVFRPGPPPFGQANGLSGDGLSMSGVAFKEVKDASTGADSALIKSAYNDAATQAQALAAATGLKLGHLLAITDYVQDEPFYNPCIQPLQGGAAAGAPVQGTVTKPGAPTIVPPVPAPAPVPPTPCNPKYYVVVWVMARYALG